MLAKLVVSLSLEKNVLCPAVIQHTVCTPLFEILEPPMPLLLSNPLQTILVQLLGTVLEDLGSAAVTWFLLHGPAWAAGFPVGPVLSPSAALRILLFPKMRSHHLGGCCFLQPPSKLTAVAYNSHPPGLPWPHALPSLCLSASIRSVVAIYLDSGFCWGVHVQHLALWA